MNTDVLAAFDQGFDQDPRAYWVGTVAQADKDGKPLLPWLEHPTNNPRFLHFLSSMSNETWHRTCGFDARYNQGISYEDNAFSSRIRQLGIEMRHLPIPESGCHGIHQWHSRGYQETPQAQELIERNRQLYISQEQKSGGFLPSS